MSKIYGILIATIILLSTQVNSYACHAIALVNFNQQTATGSNITLNAASDSPTCGCAVYWLDVEVRCIGQAFDGAAFNPGFLGPLATYPYFQSIAMNKPDCVIQNYPGVVVPYAGLCPGTTYQYRMRENHNGQAGPWCATQTFVTPGVLPAFTATINTSNNNICAGNCVTITATPTGGCQIAVLYSWNTGATTPSINVCPGTTTTYTCTVTDDCSNQQVVLPMTINVVPNPIAGTASVNVPSVCSGQTVNLTLTGSAGGIQWQSAPNSGGPFTNIGGATAATLTSGALTAATCFRAEVIGCGAPVYSNVVCVTINPTPTVTIPAQSVCAGQPATLTPNVNPAGGTFLWNTGATTSTLTDSPAITTTYTLTYTAAGCPQTATGTININAIPTVAINTVNICNGNPGTLTATPNPAGGTFLWNTGATTASITDTPPTSTSYNVTYTLNGCTASGSGMINIGVNPQPSFTAPPNCDGNSISFFDNTLGNITGWLWDFGDGNTSTLQNPTHLYATGGTFPVTLTAFDGPCSGTTTIPITIFEMPVPSFTFVPGCATTSTTFTSTSTIGSGSITVFDWDITGGIPSSASTQNTSTVYSTGGTYNVELYIESNNGCADSITQVVTIPELPVSDFSFVEQCLGTPTCFTDLSSVVNSTVTQWSWDFGDGNVSTAQNPCNNYSTAGVYTVTLTTTSAAGCTDIASYTVNAFTDPTASFTTSPVCFGQATQFTNTSIGGLQTDWDFGDGNTSTLSNPVHTYATAGTFNVTLTVTTGICSHFVTQVITVNPLPVAAFTSTPACPNLNTNFTDISTVSSGTITGWEWDFINGTPSTSLVQNPIVVYSTGGTNSATLIVTTNNGCKDTITNTVIIPFTPSANFSATSECLGTPTCFTDLSTVTNSTITGWSYNFVDGSPLDLTQNPCHTYATAGTFLVELTATSADGCVSSPIVNPVDVFGLPVASFTVNNVCGNLEAIFVNTSTAAANYNWDFGNGNTSTLQNPTHQYAPGTYTVTLTISSGSGCSDDVTGTVTVHPMPVADFSNINVCLNNVMNFTDLSTISTGSITNWNWNFGDSQTSTLQNPSNTYAADGTYNVTLTVTTNNNCSNTTSASVVVFPLPEVDFTATNVCLNATTNFTNNTTINSGSIASYAWDFGDGVGTSTQLNPTYTYTSEGSFTVDLIAVSDNGCTSTNTFDLTVHPNPVIDFDGDILAGCNIHCVNFTDLTTISSGTVVDWNWSLGDGSTSTNQNPSNCYNNSTSSTQLYNVSLLVQSNFGCDASMTMNNYISVYPDVIADFSFGPQPTTILFNTIYFTNLSVNGNTYEWDFGNGAASTETNPSQAFDSISNFNVMLVTTSMNGCVDTAYHVVEIGPDFIIYVPNTFTPDGDGVNDVFYPSVEGFDPLRFSLQIFDRWGDLIFESSIPQSGWDGTYKGINAKDGTYVWKINVKDSVYGKTHEFIGHLNLLR